MKAELNIYQRLNEVRKAVPYIKKDAKVQGYMGVTHDMVTAKVRDKLIEFGVLVAPSLVSAKTIETTTANGKPKVRYEGVYSVSFINIDSPDDRLTLQIESHADDSGDKAPGKAISYAVKSVMLKVFSLETGESDESRVDDERKAGPITQDQAQHLRSLLKKYGRTEEQFMDKVIRGSQRLDIDTIDDMGSGVYEWSVSFVERKLKEMNNGTTEH